MHCWQCMPADLCCIASSHAVNLCMAFAILTTIAPVQAAAQGQLLTRMVYLVNPTLDAMGLPETCVFSRRYCQ